MTGPGAADAEAPLVEHLRPAVEATQDGQLLTVTTSPDVTLPQRGALWTTRQVPGTVQVLGFEQGALVVSTLADRTHGGPMQLGPALHEALLGAGYSASRGVGADRGRYRADFAGVQREEALRLVARTLVLLGQHGTHGVQVDGPE